MRFFAAAWACGEILSVPAGVGTGAWAKTVIPEMISAAISALTKRNIGASRSGNCTIGSNGLQRFHWFQRDADIIV